jgi:hypothetical protein
VSTSNTQMSKEEATAWRNLAKAAKKVRDIQRNAAKRPRKKRECARV